MFCYTRLACWEELICSSSFLVNFWASYEDKKQDPLVEKKNPTERKWRDSCFVSNLPQICYAAQITEILWVATFHNYRMIKFMVLRFLLDLMCYDVKFLFCFLVQKWNLQEYRFTKYTLVPHKLCYFNVLYYATWPECSEPLD